MRMQKPSCINRRDRKKHHARRVMVLTIIALLSYFSTLDRVQADDGDLDKSFGAGGKVVTDFFGSEDEATSVAIQSDGKIIAVGSTRKPLAGANRDFALARYNTDGSLDTTFGSGGKVATDFFGRDDFALAVAIQQDGKIVATGKHFKVGSDARSTGYCFATARHNSDGSLDTSFGSGGKVTGDLGQADAIAIQGDGKIVVAGWGITDSQFPASAFMLSRYNSDGSLDTSFAGSGKVLTDFFPGSSFTSGNNARVVAIQADGKIVAAGSAFNYVAKRVDYAIARYNNDGSLDTGFGSGGEVTTPILDGSSAMAVAIHSDGKTFDNYITLY
jgi:uncharacterized delta-60 repeat protein